MTACSYPPPYRLRHFVSQGKALLTDFLFARNARIFAALRQKPQKLALFSAFSPSHLFQQKFFQCLKNLVFGLQKCVRILLPWRVFGLLALAHCFPGAFSTFSHLRIASPKHFRLSRTCALLPWRVFGFLALAHCFPGAFLGFSRLRIAFPVLFWVFRVCARLPQLVFGFLALAHGFPGSFLCFSRLRTAFSARFRALRVCALLAWHVLGFHRSAMRCLRLFVCSHRSHFCRKALPCDKNHKNSRRVFGFQKCAFIMAIGAKIIRK